MITVRRIQLGEGELFRQLRLSSLQEAPYAFSTTYASALQRSPESWQEQADRTAQGSDRATFIAFANDAPVGIAALYRHTDEPDTGEILQVWVAPKYRGATGLAPALVDAIFQWAGPSGFQTILATIRKDNKRAIAFYRSYGFRECGAASPNNPDEVVMTKETSTWAKS